MSAFLESNSSIALTIINIASQRISYGSIALTLSKKKLKASSWLAKAKHINRRTFIIVSEVVVGLYTLFLTCANPRVSSFEAESGYG